jgi:hypothetical protein
MQSAEIDSVDAFPLAAQFSKNSLSPFSLGKQQQAIYH